jgi:hypothetical protein
VATLQGLHGASAGANVYGLGVSFVDNVAILELAINRFSGDGILFESGNGELVEFKPTWHLGTNGEIVLLDCGETLE